jgi:hypothetical protein
MLRIRASWNIPDLLAWIFTRSGFRSQWFELEHDPRCWSRKTRDRRAENEVRASLALPIVAQPGRHKRSGRGFLGRYINRNRLLGRCRQILAVIDVPEMDQELAESVALLESRRRSLEVAQRQLKHNKADQALQEVTFKRQNTLNKEKWVSDQVLDEIHAKADVARADVQLAEANRALAAAQVDLAAATVEKNKALVGYEKIIAPFDGVISRRRVNRGDLVQAQTASSAVRAIRTGSRRRLRASTSTTLAPRSTGLVIQIRYRG